MAVEQHPSPPADEAGGDHALIDALVEVADDLDLPATLRRTVRAARTLTGARYAALGVLDEAGEALAQFIHDGLDDATAAALGQLPTGRGLLGELIRDPQPLRVVDVEGHPASVALPPGHPPVEAFVGVPVRVAGQVFGNLYLTGKPGGFSPGDERLLQALATVAGTAIRNAGDAATLAGRAVLQRALAELTTAVLAGADRDELLSVVEVAVGELLPGADVEIDPNGEDLDDRPDPDPAAPHDRRWHLALEDDLGTRVVVDTSEASPWRVTVGTHEALDTFARQAGVALRWADARAEVRRLAVRGERDRIARDLHDTVIQRLFGAGLQLDALTRRVDGGLADGIERVIGEIDAGIAELRSTIGRLDAPPARDLHDRLEAVIAALSPACPQLGDLLVSGDLDDVPAGLADDVVAVLREATTNAARHANAHSILPAVLVDATSVTVRVTDDGRGPSDADDRARSPMTSLGLRNMEARASAHGGSCELRAVAPRGAVLLWRVPLDG